MPCPHAELWAYLCEWVGGWVCACVWGGVGVLGVSICVFKHTQTHTQTHTHDQIMTLQ